MIGVFSPAIPLRKFPNFIRKIIAQPVARSDIFCDFLETFRSPKGKIALDNAIFSKLHGKTDHIPGNNGIHISRLSCSFQKVIQDRSLICRPDPIRPIVSCLVNLQEVEG